MFWNLLSSKIFITSLKFPKNDFASSFLRPCFPTIISVVKKKTVLKKNEFQNAAYFRDVTTTRTCHVRQWARLRLTAGGRFSLCQQKTDRLRYLSQVNERDFNARQSTRHRSLHTFILTLAIAALRGPKGGSVQLTMGPDLGLSTSPYHQLDKKWSRRYYACF